MEEEINNLCNTIVTTKGQGNSQEYHENPHKEKNMRAKCLVSMGLDHRTTAEINRYIRVHRITNTYQTLDNTHSACGYSKTRQQTEEIRWPT